MESFSVRDVVFVAFPFSDLTDHKLRPALVLADAKHGDWILCQITSKPYSDSRAIKIEGHSFVSGGLNLVSFVRPAKIFTANDSLIKKTVGTLTPETHTKIVSEIQKILRTGE